MRPFTNGEVARVFDTYPEKVRHALLDLRELIFETAAGTEGVGEIEETLKWGEPAYVTAESRSGSTVRIAWKEQRPDQFAMYFHCGTNLVERFRTLFPEEFRFEGNRAIVFDAGARVPRAALAQCVAEALAYHLRK